MQICHFISAPHPFQTVSGMEDDGRQQNVEKHFGVEGHLKVRRDLKIFRSECAN